jgi:hypothetical protein
VPIDFSFMQETLMNRLTFTLSEMIVALNFGLILSDFRIVVVSAEVRSIEYSGMWKKIENPY